MPFARAFLFLTMGSFLFILNQTLSGLNSCLIAVKQTANIYLTVKLEYHFQSVGCTQNPRLPEAVHKNQRELVRTKIWAWNQKSLFHSKGTCNWFFHSGTVWICVTSRKWIRHRATCQSPRVMKCSSDTAYAHGMVTSLWVCSAE